MMYWYFHNFMNFSFITGVGPKVFVQWKVHCITVGQYMNLIPQTIQEVNQLYIQEV